MIRNINIHVFIIHHVYLMILFKFFSFNMTKREPACYIYLTEESRLNDELTNIPLYLKNIPCFDYFSLRLNCKNCSIKIKLMNYSGLRKDSKYV